MTTINFGGRALDARNIQNIRFRWSPATRSTVRWLAFEFAIAVVFLSTAVVLQGEYSGLWYFWVFGGIGAISFVIKLYLFAAKTTHLYTTEVTSRAPSGGLVTIENAPEIRDQAIREAAKLFNQFPSDELRLEFAQRYDVKYLTLEQSKKL